MIRVDMAERLARHAHSVRARKEDAPVDGALVTSLGLEPRSVARLMRDLGFRAADGEQGWVWRGRGRRRPPTSERGSPHFAALAGLRRG
jgi:ATP-dependent RNA helicase SUPV3L1/SUV3